MNEADQKSSTTVSNEQSSVPPIPPSSPTPSQGDQPRTTPVPASTVTAAPERSAGTSPTVPQGTERAVDASTQSPASIPSATATPATTESEPRFKGKTKQKIHNASIVLTELYAQLEQLEQLANRAPSTRADVLSHLLKARDGLIQMQDLLRDD